MEEESRQDDRHILVLVKGLAIVEEGLFMEKVEAPSALLFHPFHEKSGQFTIPRLESTVFQARVR